MASKIVTIQFENEDLAEEFMAWMNNYGEQDYLNMMNEQLGTSVSLHYDNHTNMILVKKIE